jgi:cytochrome c-type biogenesis protein CcmH
MTESLRVTTAAARPQRPARVWTRWTGPLSLLVILFVFLLLGSGVFSATSATNATRIAHLETIIKCPSCEDATVAQSTASSALAVRHEITQLVRAGQSDQQIENALVSRYGATILLQPPTNGWTVLVWVIPAVAGSGALIALGWYFYRRAEEMAALRASSS